MQARGLGGADQHPGDPHHVLLPEELPQEEAGGRHCLRRLPELGVRHPHVLPRHEDGVLHHQPGHGPRTEAAHLPPRPPPPHTRLHTLVPGMHVCIEYAASTSYSPNT